MNNKTAKKKELIKVYELDFGEQNVVSREIKGIIDWISGEMEDMKVTDELNYTITTKYLTQKQYEKLPEWG